MPAAVNHDLDLDLGGSGHSSLLPKGVDQCKSCDSNDLKGSQFIQTCFSRHHLVQLVLHDESFFKNLIEIIPGE